MSWLSQASAGSAAGSAAATGASPPATAPAGGGFWQNVGDTVMKAAELPKWDSNDTAGSLGRLVGSALVGNRAVPMPQAAQQTRSELTLTPAAPRSAIAFPGVRAMPAREQELIAELARKY